jgi:hypothetical protein
MFKDKSDSEIMQIINRLQPLYAEFTDPTQMAIGLFNDKNQKGR